MENKAINIDNIYLGDCYDIIQSIPDKSIDCIYTDIPYLFVTGGIGKSELGSRIKEEKKQLENISKGIDLSIFNELLRVLKKVNMFIWCSKLQILDILKFIEKNKFNFEILVWCKTNPIPATNNNFLPDIEYCIYIREKRVVLNSKYELKSKWFVSPINQYDKCFFKHPTIKPLQLVEKHILHATKENDIILDPFLGSGTTAVAAFNEKRHYIGIEKEKEWYDIAQKRLNCETAVGQQSMFLI